MKDFRNYDEKYPELVYDILNYFRVNNRVKPVIQKSVLDYCTHSQFNSGDPQTMIQPDVVHEICEILVKKGVLICTRAGVGTSGMDANYIFMPPNDEAFLSKHPTGKSSRK